MPHKDSEQEDPDELDPDQEASDEGGPDKFNPNKLDLDTVVTLAPGMFTSKPSSPEAQSLRCSRANDLGGLLTNGSHVALQERTLTVLDSLVCLCLKSQNTERALCLQ